MILCVEKVLDLGSRSIHVNPALISGEAESITRKARVDEPVGDGRDSLFARCKSIDDLHGCKMLGIFGRLRMGNRHEHLFQPVEVLLSETKTYWQYLVRVQATGLGPMGRFYSSRFMHNIIRARRRYRKCYTQQYHDECKNRAHIPKRWAPYEDDRNVSEPDISTSVFKLEYLTYFICVKFSQHDWQPESDRDTVAIHSNYAFCVSCFLFKKNFPQLEPNE